MAHAGQQDIEMCNGKFLNLLDPDPSIITLEVIAHHLSQVNRYAGAPIRPISVAEHAILVAKRLEEEGNPWICLMGLHHDDSEAFLHDITRPLKDQLLEYRGLERIMTKAIATALGFREMTAVESKAVSRADNWALSCEAYYLMPSRGKGWWCEGLFDPEDDAQVGTAQWLPRNDEATPEYMQCLWVEKHYRYLRRVTMAPQQS